MINDFMRDAILRRIHAESVLFHLLESPDFLEKTGLKLLERQQNFQHEPNVEIAHQDLGSVKPVLDLPNPPSNLLNGLSSFTEALSLFVWVTDPTLRRSLPVLRQSVDHWPAGELPLDATCVRSVSWTEGSSVGVAIVLNEDLQPLPRSVYRSGQWLARKLFIMRLAPRRDDVTSQSRIWNTDSDHGKRKQYLGLPRTNIERYLAALENGNHHQLGNLVYCAQLGETSIEPEVDQVVQQLIALQRQYPRSISQKGEDAQSFEREASIIVHSALRSAELTMLADPGFWNWVAAAKLHRIIRWRYEHDSSVAHLANYGTLTLTENFAFRLWLRGELGYSDSNPADPYELARVDGIDLWRSHLFRQSYAYAQHVTRALLMLQAGKLAVRPLTTPEIRFLAKELKKLRQNVIFEFLSPAQARQLVEEQAIRAVSLAGGRSR